MLLSQVPTKCYVFAFRCKQWWPQCWVWRSVFYYHKSHMQCIFQMRHFFSQRKTQLASQWLLWLPILWIISWRLCVFSSLVPHSARNCGVCWMVAAGDDASLSRHWCRIPQEIMGFVEWLQQEMMLLILVTGAAFHKKLWGLLNGCSRKWC